MKNEQLLAMVRSLQQSIDMRSNEAARTELERFKADLFSQSAMLHAMRCSQQSRARRSMS